MWWGLGGRRGRGDFFVREVIPIKIMKIEEFSQVHDTGN